MNTPQELAIKLQKAMESNQRIENAKREIVYRKAEMETHDDYAKLFMTRVVVEKLKIEALEKELENATEIDIQAIQKEIEALG